MLPNLYLVVYILIAICALKLAFYLCRDVMAVILGIGVGYWLYCRQTSIDFNYSYWSDQAKWGAKSIYQYINRPTDKPTRSDFL